MEIKESIFLVAEEAIRLNGAAVLENNDSYCLIDDKVAGIYYVCAKQFDFDVYPLIKDGAKKENTVAVISLCDVELRPLDEFNKVLKVKQYVYRGPKYQIHVPYEIKEMTMDDYGYLASHYVRNGDDEAYLRNAIERGMLKAVNVDGEIMGFIGEHPEHALGMLYVSESHRRKGVGTALEKAMINKFIDDGKVPFDHVVLDNYKSMNLQKSLGMELDSGCIHWFF